MKWSLATIKYIERTAPLSFSKFEISTVGIVIVYNSLILKFLIKILLVEFVSQFMGFHDNTNFVGPKI